MLWRKFETTLPPEEIRKRIGQLHALPGKAHAEREVVCGRLTENGAQLWLLSPHISYRGDARPPLLLLKISQQGTGSKVICHPAQLQGGNWKSLIIVFIAGGTSFIGGLQQRVPLGKLLSIVFLWTLAVSVLVKGLFWIVEHIFPSSGERDRHLMEWIEKCLLSENGFSPSKEMMEEAARLAEFYAFRAKGLYHFIFPYSSEILLEKLEEWAQAENWRRSEELVSTVKMGQKVKEPRKDRMEVRKRGKQFILRSNRGTNCFAIKVVDEGQGNCVLQGKFINSPEGILFFIAFELLVIACTWQQPFLTVVCTIIYLLFIAGDLFHPERLESSRDMVLFLREHLVEEAAEPVSRGEQR